jgi:acetyl-CoA carboxylase biotin carboxyl carrier protein
MSKKPINKKPVTQDSAAINLNELEGVLELMERHQISELKWSAGGKRLHLRTAASFSTPTPAAVYSAPPAAAVGNIAPMLGATPVSAPVSVPAANQKQILSPFVGTFYRAASPTSGVYVKEGQVVKPGDVLCIVEAMKLMNEIESDLAGKVISILVENGQPVEFGEPLFLIET